VSASTIQQILTRYRGCHKPEVKVEGEGEFEDLDSDFNGRHTTSACCAFPFLLFRVVRQHAMSIPTWAIQTVIKVKFGIFV
jgi:hypothetical protein